MSVDKKTADKSAQRQPYSASLSLADIAALPCKAIPDRKIDKTTCEYFGVKSEFSTVLGKVIAHYFPVYKGGKITGYMKRDLTKPKKQAFSSVWDTDKSCELLGQHKCESGVKLFIVEGQYDYLSLWQAMMNEQQYAGKYVPNVVSLGFGTANAVEHISNNMEFVNRYNEVITVFDNDRSSSAELEKGIVKGQDAVSDVAMLIPSLKNVVLKLNDPNEYLVSNKSKELYKLALFEAKEYEIEQIVYGAGSVDDLMTPTTVGIDIPCFPKLMSRVKGLRAGELTILLAPPKSGKTTLCKTIHYLTFELIHLSYPGLM